jgi:hypothetical protein
LIVETLQSFINKHTIDLENVQMSKKKEKGEVIGLIGLGNVMFVVCINEQESAMWKCRQSNV